MHENGIERAVLYLTKMIGIQQLKEGPVWEQLSHWNKIRNCLAHKDSILNQQAEVNAVQELDLETRQTYLEEEITKVQISPESIINLLKLMDEYLEKCVDFKIAGDVADAFKTSSTDTPNS